MQIEINGKQIIGVDAQVAKAIVEAKCHQCLHRTITHKEDGCQLCPDSCNCSRGYNTYILLKDNHFLIEIIKEGMLQ